MLDRDLGNVRDQFNLSPRWVQWLAKTSKAIWVGEA